jgi:outer membrane receptor for ferrienterochelin and colicins
LKKVIFIALIHFCIASFAQQKDSVHTFDEVVVTATRTNQSIGNIPVPIQVISKQQIKATGSQKLSEILQEQTGLVIAENPLGTALQGYPNPFGSGVQMQGLDPAYTLILIDGEPLVGRNAGVLNLGRIAIGNIKQIEIVKGPSTSLYGSDAMAGVINIITEKPTALSSSLFMNAGSYGALGVNGSYANKFGKLGVQLFGATNQTDGYDLDKSIYGKTVDANNDFNLHGKLIYDFNNNTSLQLSVRHSNVSVKNDYEVLSNGAPAIVKGNSIDKDWNAFMQLKTKFSKHAIVNLKLYATGFDAHAEVFLQKTNALYDRTYLNQLLLRPELLVELGNEKNKWLLGGGYTYETVEASRYANKKYLGASFLLMQKELQIGNWQFVLGARYDANRLYADQLSPKLAIAYQLSSKLKIDASFGFGFKTPDFRQQFLNFNNNIIGYTLLGADELYGTLQQMKQTGLLDPTTDISAFANRAAIQPEKSMGYHLGFKYAITNNTQVAVQLFRNDISNLIERFTLPFSKTNSQSIFSYQNVSKVYTQGMEVEVKHKFSKQFSLQAGYQLLLTANKDELQRITDQKVLRRDPVTFVTSYTTVSDYGGLFNRSTHTANLRLFFQNEKGWTASLRSSYRSAIGYADLNGNALLDDEREYIPGFVLVNITVGKSIANEKVVWQIGVNNLFDYSNTKQLPSQQPRTIFLNCQINIDKIFKQKT